MNYALIGCSRISSNHIKAALENNVNIVAVCDVMDESMERIITTHELQNRGINKYNDYKEMIDSENIDFVSIATGSGVHAEIALYCIEKGVHVIVEKPLAMSIEDCDKIIKLSKEKNVKVCSCHQNRFNVSVQKLRKEVEEGSFGKLSHGTVHVRWNRNEDYYKQSAWRGTWAQDGGTLMNQCIHSIDILRWMMGDEIEEVYGVTTQAFHDYLECEDLGTAIIKFKNGAVGMIEGTTNVYPQNLEETLYMFGENGTVKLGGKSLNTIEIWDFEKHKENNQDEQNAKLELGTTDCENNKYGKGHSSVWQDFIDAIKNDRKPYIDAEDGKRAVEIILAIYKSSALGKPVKLPLEEASCMDFAGMFD